MNSIKVYFAVWLSGMIAGLVLIERWRRMGGDALPGAANAGPAVQAGTRSTALPGSDDKPKVTKLIATGAKADAERARRLLAKATPWADRLVANRTNIAGNGVSAKV